MGAFWSWAFAAPPHKAVKYGDARPTVPSEDKLGVGAFHRSYDDRLWLFTRAWEPSDKSKTWATLMIVHGTVDHTGVYAELGEQLARQGVAVFASDMRGWGRSDGEPLYFHDVDTFKQDILTDYERIHAEGSPYERVKSRFLLGKSIGGLITAWAVSQHADEWTGLIGLSGAYHLDSARMPSKPARACLQAMSFVLPKFPFKRLFDPRLIVSDGEAFKAWEEDPLVNRGKVTVSYVVEMLRTQAALPGQLDNWSLPALMLWGTGDRVVTEAGHQMMVDVSGHPASELIRYPGGFHNLLAEPSLKASVMSDIESWMAKLSK